MFNPVWAAHPGQDGELHRRPTRPAVHRSGNAYPGMLNVWAWTYVAIACGLVPTLRIASATIFTYA